MVFWSNTGKIRNYMTESVEIDLKQVRKAAKNTLIDCVNDAVRYANNHRNKQKGILCPTFSMKHINEVVAIARNPGPGMNVNRKQFHALLELAGYDPNKLGIRKK